MEPAKTKAFYNTIQLNDCELKEESEKAIGLQIVIKKIYTGNPFREISPWQMKHYLEGRLEKRVNINSVRRSISNLKNERILVKTEFMRKGDEGKNEHYYVLNSEVRHGIAIQKKLFEE